MRPTSSQGSTNLFERYPALPYALIAGVALALVVWFLWSSPREFPMDDTYIHLVYARNLSEQGVLMFNRPGEAGVGTSSFLWVLLLAGGHLLGIPLEIVAKAIGILSLAGMGCIMYALLRPSLPARQSLIAALLVVGSGNIVWFALSGMETTLFLCLGLFALLLYRRGRWAWLGIVLGLLALTRPEGLAMAASVGLMEVWRARRIPRGLVVAAVICAALSLPWYIYLYGRTGSLLPTSALGKQITTTAGLQIVLEANPHLAFVSRFLGVFPGIVYPVLWLLYLLVFVLGGMALPAPLISLERLVGNPNYTMSVWALPLWALCIFPLLWFGLRPLTRPRAAGYWRASPDRWLALVFLFWVVFHNLAYMLLLPIPGTASRYGAVNHVALWLLLALGLFAAVRRLPRAWPWLAAGLAIVAIANTVYWQGVYAANLEHMVNVRIAAARFVRDELPSDSLCGVFDVGAIRYHSGRMVIDLGGLIDPELGERFLTGEVDVYLVEHGATCLVLPGKTNTGGGGWFDFVDAMGLRDSALFQYYQMRELGIDQQTWLRGYLPTGNYQATVEIYSLELTNP